MHRVLRRDRFHRILLRRVLQGWTLSLNPPIKRPLVSPQSVITQCQDMSSDPTFSAYGPFTTCGLQDSSYSETVECSELCCKSIPLSNEQRFAEDGGFRDREDGPSFPVLPAEVKTKSPEGTVAGGSWTSLLVAFSSACLVVSKNFVKLSKSESLSGERLIVRLPSGRGRVRKCRSTGAVRRAS